MVENDYDKFRMCNILIEGDVAKFIRIDELSLDYENRTVYQGIIVDVARPGSDGEITYTVLCDDNIKRFFGDYETVEEISLINGSVTSLK